MATHKRTFHLRKNDALGEFDITCYVDGVNAGYIYVSGEDIHELFDHNGAPALKLERLWVEPEFRRQGIGTALMDKMMRRYMRVHFDEYALFVLVAPITDAVSIDTLIKFYAQWNLLDTFRSSDNEFANLWYCFCGERPE